MSLFRLAGGKIVEGNLNDNNSGELLFKELAATFLRPLSRPIRALPFSTSATGS